MTYLYMVINSDVTWCAGLQGKLTPLYRTIVYLSRSMELGVTAKRNCVQNQCDKRIVQLQKQEGS